MIDPPNIDKLIDDINATTASYRRVLSEIATDNTYASDYVLNVLRATGRLRVALSQAHGKLRVFEEARDRFLSGVLDEPEPEELLEVED